MPLVTNRCKKHKNAYPENECPFCAQWEYNKRIEASRTFFKEHGHQDLSYVLQKLDINLEEVYQHFRARMLEELSPRIVKLERGHEP